jgi:hypothetical protein
LIALLHTLPNDQAQTIWNLMNEQVEEQARKVTLQYHREYQQLVLRREYEREMTQTSTTAAAAVPPNIACKKKPENRKGTIELENRKSFQGRNNRRIPPAVQLELMVQIDKELNDKNLLPGDLIGPDRTWYYQAAAPALRCLKKTVAAATTHFFLKCTPIGPMVKARNYLARAVELFHVNNAIYTC